MSLKQIYTGANAASRKERAKNRRFLSGYGVETPWLISKMIQGERPLTVHARIDSARGHATVHVDSVELSEVTVSGGALDFLINTFFLPVFPEAKINKPFALADGIERIEAVPGQARVVMKR